MSDKDIFAHDNLCNTSALILLVMVIVSQCSKSDMKAETLPNCSVRDKERQAFLAQNA